MDEGPVAVSSTELVEDLFRKEYAHLVSALTRVLGPSNIPLAEDVVHDALVSAMHAWRFGLPRDPKAWIIRAAHNRAIDIIRREQRLLDAKATAHTDVHALAALFCFHAARLSTRLDEHGVFVPLEDQDRSRWDRARIERGLMHLARAATGDHMSRWHLEAGIACEHAIAPSIQKTDWDRIIGFYQVLAQQSWSPIVALNRALAVAERDGVDAGCRELMALAGERKLSRYPFYWAARADLERRGGCHTAARENYEHAIALARSPAERVSFERRIERLGIS